MTEIRNGAQDPADEIDAFVRQALRDDLPPEVEARLERLLQRFVRSRAESGTSLGWSLIGAGHWAVSQRTIGVAAALLLAFGFGLQASSRQDVLTESLSDLSVTASMVRSIGRASSVTCTGLPDASLGSPAGLADRVHRRWVLVRIVHRPDVVVSEFRALDEPARYQLVSDDLTQPPREIRKIPVPGAAPGERAVLGYLARCTWVVPRAGQPGLVFIIGR